MYCIYSGREIDETAASLEHIIPSSLGGCDAFSIQVERNINNRLGSEIDGKLSQDFFVALDRVKAGTKGHSRKKPSYRVPSSDSGGQPVIATFLDEGMKIFDPVSKQYLQKPGTYQMRFTLDLNLRLRFTAKAALATGYFLFGKRFVDHADCDSLRDIMMTQDLKEALRAKEDPHIRFYDSFTKVSEKDEPTVELYQAFCTASNASNVLWTYSPESIIVFVGILGKFIGMINFKADVREFPADGDFWLGHVLACQNDRLYRMSWRAALMKLYETLRPEDRETLERAREFERRQQAIPQNEE